MKVENKGVVITDFPGPLKKMIVQKVSGQVIVTYVDQIGAVDMPLKQFEQFAGAVQEALVQAREMAAATVSLTGPWNHLNDIPKSVAKVRDKVGDPIYRDETVPSGWVGLTQRNVDDYSTDWAPFRAEH